MQEILALFIVGSWLFWTLLVLFSIAAIVSLENDRYGFLTFITVLFVVIFAFKTPLPSWQNLLMYGAGYLVAGALWSLYRWWRYVREVVQKARDNKENHYSDLPSPSELSVSNNKDRIIAWIAFWPWSVFWSITHDLFYNIYDALRKVYGQIAKGSIAELERLHAEQEQEKKKTSEDHY